jgi:hypothetical protein
MASSVDTSCEIIERKYYENNIFECIRYIRENIVDVGNKQMITDKLVNDFLYTKRIISVSEMGEDKEEIENYVIENEKFQALFEKMREVNFRTFFQYHFKRLFIFMTELHIMTGDEFLDRINTILGYRFEDMLDLLKLKNSRDFRYIKKDQKKMIMDLYERYTTPSHTNTKMSDYEKNMIFDTLLHENEKSKMRNRLRERLEERRRQRQNETSVLEIQQLLVNMNIGEETKVVKTGKKVKKRS